MFIQVKWSVSRNEGLELSSLESSDTCLAPACTELYIRGRQILSVFQSAHQEKGRSAEEEFTAVLSVGQKPTVTLTQ